MSAEKAKTVDVTFSGPVYTNTSYTYDNDGRLTQAAILTAPASAPFTITLPAYGGQTLTWDGSGAFVTAGATVAGITGMSQAGTALISPWESEQLGGTGSDWMLWISTGTGGTHNDATFSLSNTTFNPDDTVSNTGTLIPLSPPPFSMPASLASLDLYTYDLDNNRMSDIHAGTLGGSAGTTNYAYNGDDQNTSSTLTVGAANTVTTNYYDANGSLTSSVTGAQTTTYTYDARNKMVVYKVNGTTEATYVYDDAGNRVEETIGTTPTYYLTDTQNPTGYDQPIEQRSTATGSPQVTYILGSRVIAQNTGGSTSYLVVDGHGSTRALTNSGGTVTSNWFTYDAFGGAIGNWLATAGTIFLFGGDAVYDPVSALCMNGDGTRDRLGFEFIQMDSASGSSQDPISLHKYLYANADPIDGYDPSGHDDGAPDPWGNGNLQNPNVPDEVALDPLYQFGTYIGNVLLSVEMQQASIAALADVVGLGEFGSIIGEAALAAATSPTPTRGGPDITAQLEGIVHYIATYNNTHKHSSIPSNGIFGPIGILTPLRVDGFPTR